MTPCDLFPLLKGRTVWLLGDSIMQVSGPPYSFDCNMLIHTHMLLLNHLMEAADLLWLEPALQS